MNPPTENHEVHVYAYHIVVAREPVEVARFDHDEYRRMVDRVVEVFTVAGRR
jgi:hypothetical protein